MRGAPPFGYDRPIQVEAYARLFRELAATPREPVAPRPALKRPFDVALSGLGLLGLAAALGAHRRRDQARGRRARLLRPGPGRPGRAALSELKFRSMVPDADRRFGAVQASEDDPRVTRIGRLLRATAMDELPQLWNIFVGDMSFVGPRALRPGEIEVGGDGAAVPLEEIPGYEARHRVTPGPHRHRADLRRARHPAPPEVPARPALRRQAELLARPPADRAVVLDHRSRARWEHRGRKV